MPDGVLGSFLLLLSQLRRVIGGFGDGVPGVAAAQDTFCLGVNVRFWVKYVRGRVTYLRELSCLLADAHGE